MEKTQVLFFSNRNDIRICLFKCSAISLLQWLNSSTFAFVNPISNLGLGNGICDTLLAWSKTLRNSPELSSRDSISVLEMLTSPLRINRCCNFEMQKWNTFECKRLFVGSFPNSNYSAVGLWNVQNVVIKLTIYVCFVQNLFWFFFVCWIKFAQAGKLLYKRHWLTINENRL